MHEHLAATRLLAAQGQAFLAVQPVDDVAADLPAFAPQQHVDPAIAIADPRCHDLMHPLPDRSTQIARARLALRRAVLPRHLAGAAL
jgi:hypothetical protein